MCYLEPAVKVLCDTTKAVVTGISVVYVYYSSGNNRYIINKHWYPATQSLPLSSLMMGVGVGVGDSGYRFGDALYEDGDSLHSDESAGHNDDSDEFADDEGMSNASSQVLICRTFCILFRHQNCSLYLFVIYIISLCPFIFIL